MSPELRIGIINHTDAPEPKMLALARGAPGLWRVEYIGVWWARKARLPESCDLSQWTDARSFGLRLSLSENGILLIEHVAAETATYGDGSFRGWQGKLPRSWLELRPRVVPAIALFIRRSALSRRAAA